MVPYRPLNCESGLIHGSRCDILGVCPQILFSMVRDLLRTRGLALEGTHNYSVQGTYR
jgi:hypothetical protein